MTSKSAKLRGRVHVATRLLDVLAAAPDAAVRAAESGWRLRLSLPTTGSAATPHCMLDDRRTGRRLADWWPASGLVTFANGDRTGAATWTELLDDVTAMTAVAGEPPA